MKCRIGRLQYVRPPDSAYMRGLWIYDKRKQLIERFKKIQRSSQESGVKAATFCKIIVRCGENVGKIGCKNGLQVSVGHLRVPGAEVLILLDIEVQIGLTA